jgi:TonB family protein
MFETLIESSGPRAPDPLDGVVPPDIVPGDIPPISMSRGTFNPSAVISLSKQAGLPDGSGGTEPRTGMDGVFMSAEVEVAAEVVVQPKPQYPPLLKHAGVSGYVDLDFVIDASGRVEPGSVRVVTSTHGAFVTPATEAILAGVYRPARYRGNAVRQLVRQRVSFQGG